MSQIINNNLKYLANYYRINWYAKDEEHLKEASESQSNEENLGTAIMIAIYNTMLEESYKILLNKNKFAHHAGYSFLDYDDMNKEQQANHIEGFIEVVERTLDNSRLFNRFPSNACLLSTDLMHYMKRIYQNSNTWMMEMMKVVPSGNNPIFEHRFGVEHFILALGNSYFEQLSSQLKLLRSDPFPETLIFFRHNKENESKMVSVPNSSSSQIENDKPLSIYAPYRKQNLICQDRNGKIWFKFKVLPTVELRGAIKNAVCIKVKYKKEEK